MRAWALLFVCFATGCAGALPSFSGASTTPKFRTDVAMGGSARVPTGDLTSHDDGLSEGAQAGGVVPVAYLRHGISRTWDFGLLVAGTTFRAAFRHETLLSDGSTRYALVSAVAPYGGWTETDEASGGRVGLDVPITYGIEFGGVYEFWVGPRIGVEHVRGSVTFDDQAGLSASATALKGGGIVGMALGVRRIHVLVELTAQWEQWFTDTPSDASSRRGAVVLTPAFAVRVRL